MRLASRFMLGLVFASLLLAADAPFPLVEHDGTQEDPDLVYNSETVGITFTDTYTAADIALARIDVEVLTETGDLLTTFTWLSGWTVGDGMIRVPIRPEATTLANGTYRIRTRVWDEYGNASEWADEYWVSKQWRTIDRPGGCRTVP